MIEIISWNDYGESTYVAPTTGAQQGSQAWVDGYDHSGERNIWLGSEEANGTSPTMQRGFT